MTGGIVISAWTRNWPAPHSQIALTVQLVFLCSQRGAAGWSYRCVPMLGLGKHHQSSSVISDLLVGGGPLSWLVESCLWVDHPLGLIFHPSRRGLTQPHSEREQVCVVSSCSPLGRELVAWRSEMTLNARPPVSSPTR